MKIVMLEAATLGDDIDISVFDKYGDITRYDNSTPEEIPERVKDADIILANKLPMNGETLKGADNLKLICLTATGVNNIDKAYTDSKGIVVTNAAGYSTTCVAQHTYAILFYLLEKLNYYDNYVKSGEYAKSPVFTNVQEKFMELQGKTWGIIGLGQIGTQVADIAKAFGCTVLYYSTSGENENSGYYRVGLDELLAESDIISIHAPLTPTTENMLTIEEFKKMKKTSILINTGRGAIINEQDLAKALEEGEIGAAGLDVLAQEPITENNPLMKIQDSRKLLITPHIAWTSVESRNRLIKIVCENIEAYVAGTPRNVV